MANRYNGTIYIGVTNNLHRRIIEHKQGKIEGFTKKYKVNKLAYYEATESINSAITREKQLKGKSRDKKIALIRSINPGWNDLSGELFQ